MTLLYADTSALARAYLPDQPEHDRMRSLLLETGPPVVTSEIAAVELSAAITAAARAGRIQDARRTLRRIDADVSRDAIALLPLRPARVFPVARRLIAAHALYAADAIHLAVALRETPGLSNDGVTLVTHDRRQVAAARAEGLAVWE
ncbi:MAG TPA: type II toxin-antitoxin system VapC family toxin [Gaiellaceae bacterium]|nr:type II toxin-antitoxin system VapC family toxin [Gaiellaceae bacterium]